MLKYFSQFISGKILLGILIFQVRQVSFITYLRCHISAHWIETGIQSGHLKGKFRILIHLFVISCTLSFSDTGTILVSLEMQYTHCLLYTSDAADEPSV